jgi:DNA-binding transcriptional LysR family regulator
MVALAPDHPLAERRAIALADLRDEDWTAALTDGLIVRACRAAGFEPNLVSITHDQLAIRALVARGLAVTLAPQLLADAFSELALRPLDGEGPTRDVYVLLPPGGRHPLVAPTLDALEAIAARLAAETPGEDRHGRGAGPTGRGGMVRPVELKAGADSAGSVPPERSAG